MPATRRRSRILVALTVGPVLLFLLVSMDVGKPTAFQSGAWRTRQRTQGEIFGGLAEHTAAPGGAVYSHVLVVKLWLPVLCSVFLLLTAIVLVFIFRRRHGADGCTSCGYDLTGNTSGTWPECGSQIVAVQTG